MAEAAALTQSLDNAGGAELWEMLRAAAGWLRITAGSASRLSLGHTRPLGFCLEQRMSLCSSWLSPLDGVC